VSNFDKVNLSGIEEKLDEILGGLLPAGYESYKKSPPPAALTIMETLGSIDSTLSSVDLTLQTIEYRTR